MVWLPLTVRVTADTLVKKFKQAVLHYPRISAAFQKLEVAIIKFRGEEVLNEWKAEEKDWMAKVVVIAEKKNLPNPYDLAAPTGTHTN